CTYRCCSTKFYVHTPIIASVIILPLETATKMHLVTRTALDIYHLTPRNILRIENSASPLHLERGGNITTAEMRTQGCHLQKLFDEVVRRHTNHWLSHSPPTRTRSKDALGHPHGIRYLPPHPTYSSLDSP